MESFETDEMSAEMCAGNGTDERGVSDRLYPGAAAAQRLRDTAHFQVSIVSSFFG